MIHCEEKLLKSVNASIKKYASDRTDNVSFFRDIGMLENLSLQSVSLNKDLVYFDEINKLLGVLITIITHPYIINERETVIMRAEQAYGLTPEMFHETVRDAKLWKDKRGVMTPKEVYYFQNIDELKNYENRFIVYLIDILSGQLNDYVKFYDFLIGTVMNGNALTQDDSSLDKAYGRLASLSKKLKRIKETDFYKIVSKANTSFTHVEATNVFKHNRAYGACYKFYVNNVTYGDPEARADDLSVYYFTRLLLALNNHGYKLIGGADPVKNKIIRKMDFRSEEFDISVEDAREYNGLRIKISDKDGKAKTDNLLVFDSSMDFEEVEEDLEKFKRADVTAVDAVTVWDAAYVEDKVISLRSGSISENEILSRYVSDKTRTVKASKQIYEDHCPVCGSKDIAANQYYHCSNCGTEYTFVGEKIWLTKLRKK